MTKYHKVRAKYDYETAMERCGPRGLNLWSYMITLDDIMKSFSPGFMCIWTQNVIWREPECEDLSSLKIAVAVIYQKKIPGLACNL